MTRSRFSEEGERGRGGAGPGRAAKVSGKSREEGVNDCSSGRYGEAHRCVNTVLIARRDFNPFMRSSLYFYLQVYVNIDILVSRVVSVPPK